MADFKTYIKDPSSTLDYGVDWSNWLATGEEITSSQWIIPTGLTLVSESNSTTAASVFIRGGVADRTYVITNRIETNQSRIDDRSMMIKCEER